MVNIVPIIEWVTGLPKVQPPQILLLRQELMPLVFQESMLHLHLHLLLRLLIPEEIALLILHPYQSLRLNPPPHLLWVGNAENREITDARTRAAAAAAAAAKTKYLVTSY
jgi:hypothetical protein